MNALEMKFRAWDPEKKEMIYFKSLPEMFGYFSNRSQLDRLHRLVWMRITGLRDRYSKEIWEGDIVGLSQCEPPNYQVSFKEGGFCYADEEDIYMMDIHYTNHAGNNTAEVIGNIYENPELLKV